jgi:N-sulfoglucosamine sulfohydrolase
MKHLLSIILLGLLIVSCSQGPDSEEAANQRPNILMIVSEDNSEQIGAYGETRVHTPALDQLAETGIRYTNAYVPYSVCSPSRAAFLTGLYPRQNGHIGLATHKFQMYKDFKTIPAYFKEAGYYTGFLGKTHVNPERLVEDFIDHRAIPESNFSKTISIEEYASEARTVMENSAKEDKPFMLIINYADAHRRFIEVSEAGYPTVKVEENIEPMPWIGSDTEAFREELKNYYSCMNRLDEGIGMVMEDLRELDMQDNTLIIYFSDHGADFPRSKGSVYEAATRVPMIVNYPKSFSAGKVEEDFVSTMDVLPTMLRAANIDVPEELVGNVLQDLDQGIIEGHEFIHTFTTGSAPPILYMQFGIRDDQYKLIYNPARDLNLLAASRYVNSDLSEEHHVQSFLYPPEYELFDLKADPYEWNNLADDPEYAEIREKLWKSMKDFQKEIKDPFYEKENIDKFIEEQKEYKDPKSYRGEGTEDFSWPHLEMFRKSNESG